MLEYKTKVFDEPSSRRLAGGCGWRAADITIRDNINDWVIKCNGAARRRIRGDILLLAINIGHNCHN